MVLNRSLHFNALPTEQSRPTGVSQIVKLYKRNCDICDLSSISTTRYRVYFQPTDKTPAAHAVYHNKARCGRTKTSGK